MTVLPGESLAVEIGAADGTPVVVRAFGTLTPGLVVHESIGDPGWVVTHERSGLCVGFADDPEQAQALAAELGAAGDWQRSGAEMSADEAFVVAQRTILSQFDAHVTGGGGARESRAARLSR